MPCGKCQAPKASEICWYCDAYLCAGCWEIVGHCGHLEAELINKQSRVLSWERRHELIMAAVGGEDLCPSKVPKTTSNN